jgi:Spy/CpxP family protein refolding chaperone
VNALLSISLPALLRRAAAGVALVSLLAACSGSHATSDNGTAAPDSVASGAPGAATSAAPDAAAPGAPGASGGRAGGRRLMAKALASVGLSSDQKMQIRSIMKATRAENVDADPETKRANYKAAMVKVEAVLTPDQLTAFHAKMAELRSDQQQSQQTQ